MVVAWVIISVLVGIGVIGNNVGTALTLYRGTLDNGGSRRQAIRIALLAAAGLAVWAGCSAVLAAAGDYVPLLPPWQLITVLATMTTLLLISRLPAVRSALWGPKALRRLLWPQFVRVVGVAFIVAMFAGILPPLFALPAGIGDVAVGVAAIRAHQLTATANRFRTLMAVNVLGIVDLMTAFAIGALAGFGVIHVSPDTSAIGRLPFALILTVGVPIFLACHITSLKLLRQNMPSTAAAAELRAPASESRTAM